MVNKAHKNVTGYDADIAIVGAGLVGLTAAIVMAEQGLLVVLVDANKRKLDKPKGWDTRVYALTPATEDWLQTIGIWPLVDSARANDVHEMHLWSQENDSPLALCADDANIAKLACIIENKNLLRALWQKIGTLNVVVVESPCESLAYGANTIALHLKNGAKITAKLLAAADGSNSFVREQVGITTKVKPFNQTALVANYSVEKAHGNVARQWFSSHNTLALLPLPNQHVSLVWSVSTDLAEELLNLTAQELSERVRVHSGNVLGTLKPVSATQAFSLKQVTATALVAARVVLLGDAAHQVHPMAGQGANLGFRDVMALQQLIAKAHGLQDIGEKVFLRQYARERKTDIVGMNTLTSGLDYLFSREQAGVKKLASWSMIQLNKHAIVKKLLIKQAVV